MRLLFLLVVTIQMIRGQYSQCNSPYDRYVTHMTSQLCQFIYTKDDSCTLLEFQSCRYYGKCLQYSGSVCTKYEVIMNSLLQQCQKRCCPVFKNQSQRIYNFLNCQSNSDSAQILPADANISGIDFTRLNTQMMLSIIGVSAGAVILIALIVARCRKCLSSNQQDQPNPIQQVLSTQRRLNPIKNKIDTSLIRQWKKTTSKKQRGVIKDEPEMEICTICLNDNPNSLLDCKHTFHKKCIWEWLNRKYTCPLCKGTSIKTIEIECQMCKMYSYECKLTQLKISMEGQDICDECKGQEGK